MKQTLRQAISQFLNASLYLIPLPVLATGALLLFPLLATAQLQDNFSDGDFTQNPAWSGDVSSFLVNAQNQLQSNGPAITGSTLYLATPSQAVVGTVWEFWANLRLATSSSNYADVFLISDKQDLKAADVNGYFVRIGNTADEVSLFRKDAGKTPVMIINGQDKSVASSNNTVRVRVSRSVEHEWQLEIDVAGTGQSYVSQGSVTDATHRRSAYFGVLVRYSSANSQKFYFDDFRITDTNPPVLENAQPLSTHTLELRFNEPLAPEQAQNIASYTLNGNIKPVSAELTGSGLVLLTFAQSLRNGVNKIAVAGIADLYGNALANPVELTFGYALPPMLPRYNELLITEIMARETPTVGLPAVEYVELHNPTEKVLTLQGIRYSDATSTAMLPNVLLQPGEYAVVVPNTQVSNFTQYGRVIGISNFPSLNNTGELLQLHQPNGRLIYAVSYNDTWYRDNAKRNGGWSLEMIDVTNPCAGAANWIASNDPRGGTPAQPNSVAASIPDNMPPSLLSVTTMAPDRLLLRFNERLDSAQVADVSRYALNPTGIGIAAVQVISPLFEEVILQLASPLQEKQLYTLTATGIRDCAGNLSAAPLTAIFALPSAPVPGDVVINEVLFNPRPGGVDFVELVNRSDKYINLQNWQLANISNDSVANLRVITTATYVLSPGQYVVLTSNPDNIRANYPAARAEAFLRMASLPSYPDAAGSVVVLQPDGRLADRFDYTERMHFSLMDDRNGISLERIRLKGPTTADNFHSAATSVSATPGYLNSQSQPGIAAQRLFTIAPKVFSPDGDGYEDFTTINYSTDQTGFVANITVFDAQGREIRKLVRNELLAVNGFFRWDGTRQDGSKAGIGSYLLYIELFDLSGQKSVHKERVVVGGRL
ncbi:lamin tail domain-containing protein [Pontibacter sp. JH31]|uniref:Lamin tail domain-containing protein n=1 Tax=Pontibacter aquaedesilientis TaxID=2766980 RepID=A0ABR7XI99_9BACT|nr:lamin tail domain-containing protein [Pontibacter aquaedesilientis]MBD1398012.1 lamin tail domain-containing protein [Pontibacter aquaedesilientis]